MLHWITSLPWPEWQSVFTATIMLILLQPARILVGVVWKHILPESRIERGFIINAHVRNQHKTPLKYCQTGSCSTLSDIRKVDQNQAGVVAVESGLVLDHQLDHSA